jgi:DNA-damage-inducible protein D
MSNQKDGSSVVPHSPASMVGGLTNDAIGELISAFEDVSQTDDSGVEFWMAKALKDLLGYSKWDSFLSVVEKAKASCLASGQAIEDHFSEVRKMVSIGSGAKRNVVDDIKLTRYACYIIAQNGDPRKRQIAFAQSYFAVQTRRQEVSDAGVASSLPSTEDEKRRLLRDEISDHNKRLASAAKGAGVIAPLDFAIFQNFGYKGLYGGLDRQGIQKIKGLKPKQNILDFMGSAELAANLFRATQTEEKLRRENIKGKQSANQAHHEVGRKVRQAIRDIGGTMPEKLAPAPDIAKIGQKSAATPPRRVKKQD